MEQFKVHHKLRGRGKDFPYILPVPRHAQSQTSSTPLSEWYNGYNWWIYTWHIMIIKVHRLYNMAHSWCCTFYAFGQIHNDKYLSLWYYIQYYHCPKNSVFYQFIPTCPHPVPSSSAFSRISYSWNHNSMYLLTFVSFT